MRNSKQTHKPTDRPTGRPVGRPEGRPASRPTARPTGRPEARGGKPAAKGKPVRPDANAPADERYGLYRDAPAPKAAFGKASPPGGPPPIPADLAATLRALTTEVKTLKAEASQKDAEIKALGKRLSLLEARQKAQEKA